MKVSLVLVWFEWLLKRFCWSSRLLWSVILKFLTSVHVATEISRMSVLLGSFRRFMGVLQAFEHLCEILQILGVTGVLH